VQQASSPM